MRALADSYLDGDGAEKNPEEAFRLYKEAADKGDGPAQFNCGILYRDGIGVKRSYDHAIHYLDRASRNRQLGNVAEDAAQIANGVRELKRRTHEKS
jgi:TPR repeat protein